MQSDHSKNSLAVQEKKTVSTKEEQIYNAKYYIPFTDIYEKEDLLIIVMELPGIERESIFLKIEKDVLDIEGKVDIAKYKDWEPVYTEYNIGHYTRKFHLSSNIDKEKIHATFKDGILVLKIPKIPEAQPKKISIS